MRLWKASSVQEKKDKVCSLDNSVTYTFAHAFTTTPRFRNPRGGARSLRRERAKASRYPLACLTATKQSNGIQTKMEMKECSYTR